MILERTTSHIAGLRRGYRLAGKSFYARFIVHLFVVSLLYGSGVGFLWASLDIYLGYQSTPTSIKKVVISKRDAWCSQHPNFWSCWAKKGTRHE